jgi:hypothetical protein
LDAPNVAEGIDQTLHGILIKLAQWFRQLPQLP